jgi:hypothetical protein
MIWLKDVETPIGNCTGSICSTGGSQHNLWVSGTGFGPYARISLIVQNNTTKQPEYSASFTAGYYGNFNWQLPFGGCSVDGRFVQATASNGVSAHAVFSACEYL